MALCLKISSKKQRKFYSRLKIFLFKDEILRVQFVKKYEALKIILIDNLLFLLDGSEYTNSEKSQKGG